MATVRGLGPARVAVDGTSYGAGMSGAARRTTCLLPRLASRGWQPVLFVGEDRAGSYLDLPGVTTVPVRVPQRPGPLRSFVARRVLPPLLRELKVTVLLTETPPAPDGPPFVLTVHDMRAYDEPRWVSTGRRYWIKRILPAAVRSAAAIITPSEFTAEQLRRHFPGAEPVVAANGCDHFPVAPQQPQRERFVFAVGPWDRRKDAATLLSAAAMQPGVRWLLAGRPIGRLPRNVEAVSMDDVELALNLRLAAAVVCASRYEGFDLPLGEALAQGATVVASDIPAHREVAGDAAYYFAAGDAPDLAATLERALRDPIQAAAALDRAAGFPWRRCAEITDEVLRRAGRA